MGGHGAWGQQRPRVEHGGIGTASQPHQLAAGTGHQIIEGLQARQMVVGPASDALTRAGPETNHGHEAVVQITTRPGLQPHRPPPPGEQLFVLDHQGGVAVCPGGQGPSGASGRHLDHHGQFELFQGGGVTAGPDEDPGRALLGQQWAGAVQGIAQEAPGPRAIAHRQGLLEALHPPAPRPAAAY